MVAWFWIEIALPTCDTLTRKVYHSHYHWGFGEVSIGLANNK